MPSHRRPGKGRVACFTGVGQRRLVIVSVLIGAPRVMGADLLSRVVLAPQELPLGIFTAAAGGVFILALVMRPARF